MNPQKPSSAEDLKRADHLRSAGRLPEAADLCQRVLEREPDHPAALRLLGLLLMQDSQPELAAQVLSRAVQVSPSDVDAHMALGVALDALGLKEQAVTAFRRASELRPDVPEPFLNLGCVLRELKRLREAREALEKALALAPGVDRIHTELGLVLVGLNEPYLAETHLRDALRLSPNSFDAWSYLAEALEDQGRLLEAVDAYHRALQLRPDYHEAHTNLLMLLHYIPGLTKQQIFEEHVRWDLAHARPLLPAAPRFSHRRDPEKRLRVGLLSGSFRRHPVGYMIVKAVENIDRNRVELVAYSNNTKTDEMTLRLQAAMSHWVEVGQDTDEALADRIRADAVDILIDLSGHSEKNRLLAVARKPAPVQVKWVGGQFNTTGMRAFDYFLTDPIETPPGDEPYYVEKLVRLPDDYICFEAPAYAGPVASLPALAAGRVTFGCFNKTKKVNPEVVALWAQILKRVPSSRLILKDKGLEPPQTARRILDLFSTCGVDPSRVELRGHSKHAELLETYGQVDIALDTFPYSGGLTTCEALWMGVPVVTLPGPTFAGRHSATHLWNAGLRDWVVATPAAYVDLAVHWASSLPQLAALRASLRTQLQQSPVCDGPRFARHLEQALRTLWKDWCTAASR